MVVADGKTQTMRVNQGALFKKIDITSAQYDDLNSTPITLIAGIADHITLPISCYIRYVHAADEMTQFDLYIGFNATLTSVGRFWGSIDEAFYRIRNNALYQIGASTYGAGSSTDFANTPFKSKTNDTSGSDLKIYTTANPGAGSTLEVYLWYNRFKI